MEEREATVIGSGPAGVACAMALIGRGARVTMLDAGMRLPEDRRALGPSFRPFTIETWNT